MDGEPSDCPDCGVEVGADHDMNCDLLRCPACGGQRISCGCPASGISEWTGEAYAEEKRLCRELGWYSRRNPAGPGYVPCGPGDEGADLDIGACHAAFHFGERFNPSEGGRHAFWDPTTGRFRVDGRVEFLTHEELALVKAHRAGKGT